MTNDLAASPTSFSPPEPVARQSHGRTILLRVLAAELALLVATGVWLLLYYSPVDGDRHIGLMSGTVRLVHRVDAQLLILTAMAAVIVLLLSAGTKRQRWASGGLGIGIWLVALVASMTGYLLPWDQLGLWAVSVGEGFEGYRWLTGDRVRFVVVGSTEIGPGSLLLWLVVHLGAAFAVAVLLVATWRTVARSSRQSPPTITGDPAA